MPITNKRLISIWPSNPVGYHVFWVILLPSIGTNQLDLRLEVSRGHAHVTCQRRRLYHSWFVQEMLAKSEQKRRFDESRKPCCAHASIPPFAGRIRLSAGEHAESFGSTCIWRQKWTLLLCQCATIKKLSCASAPRLTARMTPVQFCLRKPESPVSNGSRDSETAVSSAPVLFHDRSDHTYDPDHA